MNENIKLGCHVSMSAPNYLIGSLYEALSYNANCFMIYTGAPQNFNRVELKKLNISKFLDALKLNNISTEDVVVHAPYVMNLANSEQLKFESSLKTLELEIFRTKEIGLKYFILHPGNNVNIEFGINSIAKAINKANVRNKDVIICLETMSGKGNEIGINFQQLRQIIDLVKNKNLIGVCLDTCHINDAGYNVHDVDSILKAFDEIVGLKYLKVIHLNDSKNVIGVKKDRHANIGDGTIGFETLHKWVHHPLLASIPKILETPYVDGLPIYKQEIAMLKK